MKISIWLAAGVISLSSNFVLAHGFHVNEKEIAATLAAPAELNAEFRNEIRELRAESDRLHRIGKHNEAELKKSQAAKLEQNK